MRSLRIEVTVEDRPPRKNGAKSLWGGKDAPRVLNLRQALYDEMEKQEIKQPIEKRIRVRLIMFAPVPFDIDDKQNYVGDLDTLVAGICEIMQSEICLCKSKKSIKPRCKGRFEQDPVKDGHERCTVVSEAFSNHPRLHPSRPFLIKDDSCVAEISAEKRKSGQEKYTLIIDTLD